MGFRNLGDQGEITFEEAPHEVEAFIVYMEDYLTEARRQISREAGPENALATLRKVVTLGLSCFEEHGVPDRDLSQPITNGRDGMLAYKGGSLD
jgi:hypothetical protein